MRRRVLFAVAGSAGDLFPLIPVMRELSARGHDVRCAVMPRSLSLYLRPLGIQTYSLGSGGEVAALRDQRSVTTRFGGWASLRHLSNTLLLGSLPDDVAALEAIVADWRPDLIASASFAPSARVVGHRQHIEQVDVTIYPLLARVVSTARFGGRLRRRCVELAGLDGDVACTPESVRLAWGIGPATVVLHDPAVLDDTFVQPLPSGWSPPVGFPSWDDALRRQADDEAVLRWLDGSDAVTVAVTMGSYLGVGRGQRWHELARTVADLGVRALFLGPQRELEGVLAGVPGEFHVARFVPLSRVAHRLSVFVHHGGAGTMFTALRASTPSVVMPLAFDQIANARLIEAHGAGVHVEGGSVHAALEKVLGDRSFSARSRALAQGLIPATVAAEAAATAVLAGGHQR